MSSSCVGESAPLHSRAACPRKLGLGDGRPGSRSAAAGQQRPPPRAARVAVLLSDACRSRYRSGATWLGLGLGLGFGFGLGLGFGFGLG